MKKTIVSLLAIFMLYVPSFSNEHGTDLIGGFLNGGIAAWGYTEGYKHKEVKIYINITSTIFAIRSIVYFVKATR